MDCAGFDWASNAPLCAASATPPASTPLRDTAESLGSITSVYRLLIYSISKSGMRADFRQLSFHRMIDCAGGAFAGQRLQDIVGGGEFDLQSRRGDSGSEMRRE